MNSIALLQTLLERAEAERDTARSVLQAAELAQARARAQAEQLETYQQEFDARWTQHFRQQGSRELLQCRHSFGDRLTEAVSGQQSQVDQIGNRVRLAREALIAREQRVAAVRKLIERRQSELHRMAERREQRANDELAQRLHRQRRYVAP
jgi:flagellar FliJ protein